ncbi:MAG: B12-binding domain-containing radical SAM protein [Elusimicrobiota bacterium]
MTESDLLLVQPPIFSRLSPSPDVALLQAQLRRAGVRTRVHDSSSSVRRALKERGSTWHDNADPEADDFLAADPKFIPADLEPFLDREARGIAGSGAALVYLLVQVVTERCALELARRVEGHGRESFVVVGGPQCTREAGAAELLAAPGVAASVHPGGVRLSLLSGPRAAPHGPGDPLPGMLVKRDGRVLDGGDPKRELDLDALPFMDFSGFDMDDYPSGQLFLSASRGCVRQCSFCDRDKTYRRMTAGRVAAEIRHQLALYPSKHFVRFADDMINSDCALLGRLSASLAEIRLEMAVRRGSRDFGWSALALIRPEMTAELLRAMRRGGCRLLAYGLESGCQKTVDAMGKGFQLEVARRVFRQTKAAGIRVQVFVIAGFPGETEEDFQETLSFLESNADSIDVVSPYICAVTKGSLLDARGRELSLALDPSDLHGWASLDESNTFALRKARFLALQETIRRLGFENPNCP